MTSRVSEIPEFGFWKALGNFRLRQLLWPEGISAIAIGAILVWLLFSEGTIGDRLEFCGVALAVGLGVLAVVFTAFAVFVSLASDEYLELLESTSGIGTFIGPFVVGIAIELFVVLAAIIGKVAYASDVSILGDVCTAAAAFGLAYGLLDVSSLARQLAKHAFIRSQM